MLEIVITFLITRDYRNSDYFLVCQFFFFCRLVKGIGIEMKWFFFTTSVNYIFYAILFILFGYIKNKCMIVCMNFNKKNKYNQ